MISFFKQVFEENGYGLKILHNCLQIYCKNICITHAVLIYDF